MPSSENLRTKRSANSVKAGLEATGLYHSFELPDGRLVSGSMSLEWQRERLASFRIPDDLNGKRVLDIGPWDGFYTFEMERRGAEVTAIDYVDLDTFRAMHRVFHSRAKYLRKDLYELDVATIGTFDIVLCLGVLYHLKHPLLGLEKLCALTEDLCVVDTVVADGEHWLKGEGQGIPYAEFYEHGELGGQLDNWCGPTVGNVEAWVRAAGFASAETSRVTGGSACILAHRHWRDLPPEGEPSVQIASLSSHHNRGRSFRTAKEEYIQLWCEWPHSAAPELAMVFPEVDGFGVAPLDCALTGDGLVVSLRLPPGLCAGRHEARLKIARSRWSAGVGFYVDLPAVDVPPVIVALQDGIDWRFDEVKWQSGGWLTIWVNGLTPEADPGNVSVILSGIPHQPETVDPSKGQINVRLRPLIGPGLHEVQVVNRGAGGSERVQLLVTGVPPPIRGLEFLTE